MVYILWLNYTWMGAIHWIRFISAKSCFSCSLKLILNKYSVSLWNAYKASCDPNLIFYIKKTSLFSKIAFWVVNQCSIVNRIGLSTIEEFELCALCLCRWLLWQQQISTNFYEKILQTILFWSSTYRKTRKKILLFMNHNSDWVLKLAIKYIVIMERVK
jgi:hypothetical protein